MPQQEQVKYRWNIPKTGADWVQSVKDLTETIQDIWTEAELDEYCLSEDKSVIAVVAAEEDIEDFVPHFDGDYLVEEMKEQAEDDDPNFLLNVSKDDIQELEENVNKVIQTWLNKHNEKANFFYVHKCTWYRIWEKDGKVCFEENPPK